MQRKRSSGMPGSLGTGPGRRRLVGLLVVLAVLAVVAAIIIGRLPGPTPPGPTTSPISTRAPLPSTATYCLSAARSAARLISRVSGTVSTVRIGAVADNKTYDLRGVTVTGYPTASRYPLLFGKDNPGDATCVLGGSVTGRQSRSLTWQAIKSGLDGTASSSRATPGSSTASGSTTSRTASASPAATPAGSRSATPTCPTSATTASRTTRSRT